MHWWMHPGAERAGLERLKRQSNDARVAELEEAGFHQDGDDRATGLAVRQIEEMLLTAAQTMMGVAVLLALRFPRWAAWALLALFLVQFALTDTTGRLVSAGVYLVLATAALVWHRQTIIPTLLAPFRPGSSLERVSEQVSGQVG